MLAEAVLGVRNADYLLQLCEKLCDEGITAPRDLLGISETALETKLYSHSPLTIQEVADTKRLRRAANDAAEASSARGKKRSRSRSSRRERSRSRRARGKERSRSTTTKPELWRAVEDGDVAHVRMLLQRSVDVEEKFNGWSPLMKAAEEGHVQIIRELLNKRADVNVTNRKGRGPLSFAAAPSNNKLNNLDALLVLLEAGADCTHTDEAGCTAEERAILERRKAASTVFKKFKNIRCQRRGA